MPATRSNMPVMEKQDKQITLRSNRFRKSNSTSMCFFRENANEAVRWKSAKNRTNQIQQRGRDRGPEIRDRQGLQR